MRNKIKSQKGITMIILTIAIIILVLVSNILIYNAKDGVYIEHLENMYTDIENLRNKVIEYNVQYGALPANTNIEYNLNGKDDLKENWISKEELEHKFYVIDLKTLEGISLNYGRDYEKVDSEMNSEEMSKLEDIYIVSEISQNVYYVKGISVEGKKYYSDREKDETVIDLYYNENEGEDVVLAENISGANYGDYIDYKVDLNDDGDTTNDWRIYYNNGSNIYIIAANFLPNEKLPKETIAIPAIAYNPTVGDRGPTKKETKYGTVWERNKLRYSLADITDETASKFYINEYRNKYKDKKIEGSEISAEMLKTDIWKKFAVIDGAEAIASPTLEMFVRSWNDKGYTKLYCDNVDEGGYHLGTNSMPEGNSEDSNNVYKAINDGPGVNDSLYFMNDPETYVGGYFLASPYSNDGLDEVTYVAKSWGLLYGFGENILDGSYECFRN